VLRTKLLWLTLPRPMGYLAAWAPADALRVVLAIILAGSAVKLWSKRGAAS
jgi:hypothetical protein